MLGLFGFIKKKLDLEGKLPSKWQERVESNPIKYDADTNTITISAGTYIDYKGNAKVIEADIVEPLESSSSSNSRCSIWISFGTKWTKGYGFQSEDALTDNNDGNTIYIMGSKVATHAFRLGECDSVSSSTFIPSNFVITFNPENYTLTSN